MCVCVCACALLDRCAHRTGLQQLKLRCSSGLTSEGLSAALRARTCPDLRVLQLGTFLVALSTLVVVALHRFSVAPVSLSEEASHDRALAATVPHALSS